MLEVGQIETLTFYNSGTEFSNTSVGLAESRDRFRPRAHVHFLFWRGIFGLQILVDIPCSTNNIRRLDI
ncbi:hypothetical protein ScPMuIL_005129 [Solemya velum]